MDLPFIPTVFVCSNSMYGVWVIHIIKNLKEERMTRDSEDKKVRSFSFGKISIQMWLHYSISCRAGAVQAKGIPLLVLEVTCQGEVADVVSCISCSKRLSVIYFFLCTVCVPVSERLEKSRDNSYQRFVGLESQAMPEALALNNTACVYAFMSLHLHVYDFSHVRLL